MEPKLKIKRFRRRDFHGGDVVFSLVLRCVSLLVPALLFCIGLFLVLKARTAISRFGFNFFFSSVWDPVNDHFGCLPVVFGTLFSSAIAVTLAAPLSVGVGLFLSELAPKKVSSIVGFLVEMLAAVPSVVYGLWGIFVLTPWLRSSVEPFFGEYFDFLPFFQGPPYGVGMLAAGIILAIMITPTISAISSEVFKTVPRIQREGALALGATRWETIRVAVLKAGRSGIFGAVILGLGRALGETMAVTMVIGNRAQISASLFAPGQTMASVLANEYAEATSDIHLAALVEVGLALFIVTFLINGFARFIIIQNETRGRH